MSGAHRVSTREIWSLTWPQALMMFFQFLVGFIAVVVAGRINPHLQGALGIITQCQFFLLVLGMALVNGGLAAISQARGAGLHLRSHRYVGLVLKLSAAACILTLAFGLYFRRQMLEALGVPKEIFELTLELWVLFLAIMPGSYLSFTTAVIFRAHKNVWVPLASVMVVFVVATIANFGLGLGMFGMPALGAQGIIWASVISVTVGGLLNLAVLLKKKMLTLRSFAPWRWEKRAFPYIVKVAIPSGGSQFLWQFGYLVLFFITNTLPEGSVSAVSGLTAGMRVEALLFLPAMSFSFTGSILVGHCLGAGNRAEAKRVGMRVTLAGAGSMSLAALALFPFVDAIAAFVSPDPAIQRVAASYMVFNFIATPFSVTSMIMSGIFTGAGATLFGLIAFSCGTWLVRLPLAWYMGHIVWRSASGVFLAMLVSQVVQTAVCLYFFFRRDWYRFSSTAKRTDKKASSVRL